MFLLSSYVKPLIYPSSLAESTFYLIKATTTTSAADTYFYSFQAALIAPWILNLSNKFFSGPYGMVRI